METDIKNMDSAITLLRTKSIRGGTNTRLVWVINYTFNNIYIIQWWQVSLMTILRAQPTVIHQGCPLGGLLFFPGYYTESMTADHNR